MIDEGGLSEAHATVLIALLLRPVRGNATRERFGGITVRQMFRKGSVTREECMQMDTPLPGFLGLVDHVYGFGHLPGPAHFFEGLVPWFKEQWGTE